MVADGHTDAWINFGDLSDWTTPTFEVSASASGDFDASVVRFFGLNVGAGSEWTGAEWSDITVQIDSVTFSDGAALDLDFDEDAAGLASNNYNSPSRVRRWELLSRVTARRRALAELAVAALLAWVASAVAPVIY